MKNADMTDRYLFTQEVYVNLNVFGAAMLDGVGQHVDGTNIVIVDHCGRAQRSVKFLEDLAEPATLVNSMGNRAILRLCTRPRNSRLTLGGPRDKTVAEVDTEA